MAKGDTTTNGTSAKTARRKPGPKPRAATSANDAPDAASVAPAPKGFRFGLRDTVTITQSGENGSVRGRAEWTTGNISYFIAYTTKSGEFKEAWIDQDLLDEIKERRKARAPRNGKA
jgi:hypothetical protein